MSEPVDITKRRPTLSPEARRLTDSPFVNLMAHALGHIGSILRAEMNGKIAALQNPRGLHMRAIANGVSRACEQVTAETDAKLAALEAHIRALEERPS
jgi:hypothetical protein